MWKKNQGDPTLTSIVETFFVQYQKTPAKLQLLDSFCACSLAVAVVQYLYGIVVGSFPFNAFLAGIFCCLGSFVLTLSLRLRISSMDADISEKQAYLGYVLSMTALFLAVWNYIG